MYKMGKGLKNKITTNQPVNTKIPFHPQSYICRQIYIHSFNNIHGIEL